jgi:hypothetical protein
MNKKLFWGIFAVIILGAVFLRTWNYSDWLYFKWDQGRDAFMLAKAVESGPGELPLLGPRAARVGAEYLRLGPAYYYFQYLPAAVLNSTHPTAFAYADLIMSILAIPMLYVFCRLYFSARNSLMITALYAFAFLVIQYSRFAWNPNSVPLFMLMTFYGMLCFAQSKKLKNQIKWLALWALGFSLASQLHFYALFSLVAISGIFFIYHLNFLYLANFFVKTSATHFIYQFSKLRSLLGFSSNFTQIKKVYQRQSKELKINIKKVFTKNLLKAFGVAIGVILITNIPMIISEIKTDASNARIFPEAVSKKADEDKTFGEKLYRNFEEYANFNYMMLTSFENRSGKKSDDLPLTTGAIIFLAGFVLPIYLYRKEKNPAKKNFLFLLPVWIGVLFIITIGASYGLRPRYFTPIFPTPFIIVGLILVLLNQKLKTNSRTIGWILFAIILLLNLNGVKEWFVENKLSQTQAIETKRNHILKKDDGITLGQFEKAATYILDKTKTEKTKVLVWTKAEYKQPLKYLLKKQRPEIVWDFVNKSKELNGKDFMIAVNTVNGDYDSVTKDVRIHTSVLNRTQFGQLMVLELKIHPENLPTPDPEDQEKQDDDEEDEETGRVYWKDLL